MFLTSFSSANGAAKFAVGPVLTSRRPFTYLSLESPVGHPPAVNGVDVLPVKVVAFVGQPTFFCQVACERRVFPGSNSPGFTSWKEAADAIVANPMRPATE